MVWIERFQLAIKQIQKGKIPPIWKIFPSIKLDIGLKKVDRKAVLPEWIQFEGKVSYVENKEKAIKGSRYFLCLTEESEELSTIISYPEKVKTISFDLLNTNHFSKISIESRGVTKTGEQKKLTTEYVSGSLFRTNAIPVSLEFEEPVKNIELSLKGKKEDLTPLDKFLSKYRYRGDSSITDLAISAPAVSTAGSDKPPIFLITVDTFRYDNLESFEPVLEELGDKVFIPQEPRTQAKWTRPSHATILTGVNPGTHKYVIGFGDDWSQPVKPIPDNLKNLAEKLSDKGYRCGACTSIDTIGPEYGFARGFQRFDVIPREWEESKIDGGKVVDVARNWIDRTRQPTEKQIFFFMHLFDPHFPYLSIKEISEELSLNVNEVDDYLEEYLNRQSNNYLEILNSDHKEIDTDLLQRVRKYYEKSLKFTAKELKRFIADLKSQGLFEDALIIIAGDHGEEFLERGICGHSSLYDANIRPGMIVKPPSGENLKIPEKANTIDIYPTIMDFIGMDIPDQCEGNSWLDSNPDKIRITEGFTPPNLYLISVEKDGKKGIFTYETDLPDRPKKKKIERGPKKSEFYDIQKIREEKFNQDAELSESKQKKLRQIAEEFIKTRNSNIKLSDENVDASVAIKDRLEKLGYK